MSLHTRWVMLRNTGLILVLCLTAFAERASQAADPPGPLVPDAEYPKLVKRFAKGIQDALKGDPSEENAAKAQVAAVLIASAAQQNLGGTDGQQRATVRDSALKVVDAIKAKKYKDAAALAEALPNLAADPKAKKEKVKLDEQVTFPMLMHQFRPNAKGGWGIYGHLYKLQTEMKPVLPRSEPIEPFLMEANQIALSADLAVNQKFKKQPDEYQKRLEAMRAAALDLAEALRDKDAHKAAVAPLSKLTTTCFACHKDIRDK